MLYKRSFDMREAERTALSAPHSTLDTPHFLRLPLMQEITGAKPVRDANFCPQSIRSDALLWYGK